MTDNRKSDSCPKQEVEIEEGCGPCGATSCDADEDVGCDTCE